MSYRVLGRLEDIPENGARGFPPLPGGFTGLFVVRRGDAAFAYVNSCPHIGLPLDTPPDRFLDRQRQVIVCAAHGARFRPEDGLCIAGPCIGDALEAVPLTIVDGELRVAEDAGR